MSKRKTPTSSELKNPTLVESSNSKDKAIRLAKEHSTWERKQTFEVIRPDHKTVIYRRIKDGKKQNKSVEIHKGKI